MKPKKIMELEEELGGDFKRVSKISYGWRNSKILEYQVDQYNSITSLKLYRCGLKTIDFLSKFKSLQTLDLSSNQLSDVSGLSNLVGLQTLYLSDNQLSDVSDLSNLVGLQTLNLRSNQLSDVSDLSNLVGLQTLDLSDNQLSDVSLTFLNKFKKLEYLYLSNNPIQNIPKEIFDKQYTNVLQNVRNYLEDIEKGKSKNKDVKIILIGNGSVGKTQIACRLVLQKEFKINQEHDSTHGIVLLQRPLKDLTLNIWDFAGQDIYHATHRLFMQTRALFVLVWDFENENNDFHQWEGKKYKNEKLLYWLEYAKCFGQDSPILVVQNKVDTAADKEKTLLGSEKKYYQNNFPIIDFIQTSAKEDKGFKLLEKKLTKAFKENKTLKQHLLQDLPNSWIAIRQRIQGKKQKGLKTLSFKSFKKICKKEGVLKSAATIASYLHDTGVLYYKHQYFKGDIILDQSWAMAAIYKILDREGCYFEILEHQEGKLEYEDLCEIWEENTDGERELFIEFMLSTELCFETTKKEKHEHKKIKDRTFVVPQLLSEQKPKEVLFLEKKKTLTIEERLSYQFLPSVFIHRFIVKAHRIASVENMWQQGVFLETNKGNAIVEADYQQKEIVIRGNSRFLIEKIKEELETIGQEGKVRAQRPQDEAEALALGQEYRKDLYEKQVGLKALRPSDYLKRKYEAALRQENNELFEHGYALFIGIGYEHWRTLIKPLKGALKDVEDLKHHFTNPNKAGYKKENVIALREEEATAQGILTALDDLADKAKNDPNATVIIHYSGHGETNGKESFLIPYDFDILRWRHNKTFDTEKVVLSQQFAQKIAAINAKKSLIILDCCHAENIPVERGLDGFSTSFLHSFVEALDTTFESKPIARNLNDGLQKGNGRVILTSCQTHEKSLDLGNNGLFTKVLLECLNGKGNIEKDGWVRLIDLMRYIPKRVAKEAKRFTRLTNPSFEQNPVFKRIEDVGVEDFVICKY